VPGLPLDSQITSRVVLHCHRDLYVVVEVLLDRFHYRDLAGQREIQNVAAGSRMEADTAAARDLGGVEEVSMALRSNL